MQRKTGIKLVGRLGAKLRRSGEMKWLLFFFFFKYLQGMDLSRLKLRLFLPRKMETLLLVFLKNVLRVEPKKCCPLKAMQIRCL